MFVNQFSVVVCSISFLYTFYILCKLMNFLSNHNEHQKTSLISPSDANVVSTLWSLLVDTSLICAFTLQHSVMATEHIKGIFRNRQFEGIERSIYNLCSAIALHFLIQDWQHVPWLSLWDIDTANSTLMWSLFTTVHILGWSIIYSGCIMMDMSDLAGLKQVYYKITNRPCPMVSKSRQLQRFYAHMRHPSFTGFLMVLWIHPFMTIDRLIQATLLTIYMALMWNVDEEDYQYHTIEMRRKQRELF